MGSRADPSSVSEGVGLVTVIMILGIILFNLEMLSLQKRIFHFDKKNLLYTINRFNFFELNNKIY